MIAHYLKIALRNMQKQKMYAAVNIGGFAIGIAACLLIALFINNELSYDKDNPNKDRIYRIIGEAKVNGVVSRGASFPAPMAKALLQDFPEIEKAGRIMPNALFGGSTNQVRRTDQQADTYEEGFCFADTATLDILNVRMVYGNRAKALAEPYSVVLGKSMADKYFPNQNPVGQTLIFNDNPKLPVKVGGVMEDLPANSHLQYKAFISLAGLNFWEGEQETWNASNYGIYLQLKPGINIEQLEKKITADVITKYMLPSRKARGIANPESVFKDARLYLQPLSAIHLHSYDIDDNDVKHGDIRFVWLFAAIAVFILVLACINFLNLSTARSANRAKEVGVRKVVGSLRIDLIKQFLAESLVYSFLSFLIAIALAAIILPWFNTVSGLVLHMPWRAWWLLPVLVAAATFVGLLAGIYPAFYLSYFKPVHVLKGNLSRGSKATGLRSTLVVFQFTVSVVLLIGTAVIYKQMQYILNSKTGFDKEQVVMIKGTDALRGQSVSFKNELLQLPFVRNVSVSDFLPVAGTKRNGNMFWQEGKTQEDAGISGQHWEVDDSYLPTLGMKLLAGRNFSKAMPTDSQATIINKAMADKLGYKDPVGKMITNGWEHKTIIGVVDNFYFESLKQQVAPLCLVLGNSNSIVSVKVQAANMKEALAVIQGVWKSFIPHQPMRYDFLDESYAAMYADVQRTGYLFTGFAVLAIIVACLGLFALSAFMAEQRSKEIGIRKVLGASVANVFTLLTANFLKLVLLSLVIAVPLGWLMMNRWLQDYTYRISITWDVFAVAAVVILIIAVSTIFFQAIKAAIANPVKSLRSE